MNVDDKVDKDSVLHTFNQSKGKVFELTKILCFLLFVNFETIVSSAGFGTDEKQLRDLQVWRTWSERRKQAFF